MDIQTKRPWETPVLISLQVGHSEKLTDNAELTYNTHMYGIEVQLGPS